MKLKKILSRRALRFVAAHCGNATEAAAIAGYKNPNKSARKLMAMASVRAAIEEKQQAAIGAMGRKLGAALSRTDLIQRLLRLADLPPEKTKDSIGGQVNALRVIADIQGWIGSKQEDLTKQLEGKTDEEKEFFCIHGYWPDEKPN